MTDLAMPDTIRDRATFRAWHQGLRTRAASWRRELPTVAIGVDPQTSFLVPSLRGDDPKRSRLPLDDNEWRALGWTVETTSATTVRSVWPSLKGISLATSAPGWSRHVRRSTRSPMAGG